MTIQHAVNVRHLPSKTARSHAPGSMRIWPCNLAHRRNLSPREYTRPLQICSSSVPDWDAEMSIFQKRASKPNQLNTIRQLVEEVDTGRVRYNHRLKLSELWLTQLVLRRCCMQVIA